MFNTDNAKMKMPKRFISKQDILNKVSQYDIFRRYLGDFKIGRTYNSPLREDKSPSFGLFISSKDNELLYKDFANGDCGDAFKFVKKLKNITSNSELYKTIYEDMNLYIQSVDLESKKKYIAKRASISVSRKKMTDKDYAYWAQFGITKETLKFFKVNAISNLFINNVITDKYTEKEPMYCYKVFDKFKIYKPLSPKQKKWRGNLSILDIQGFEQLPEYGDLLIITKSLKDVMVLYEMGYDSISPASESADLPEIVMANLTKRFKKIIVFYDRDAAGVKFARKIVNKYKTDFFFINKKHKTKDISDFVSKYSLDEAIDMLSMELKK